MGLFSRKKQQKGIPSKYSINMKDKKTRKYFEEQFGSLAHKEDIPNIFSEMQRWAETKNNIDRIPYKTRMRMLRIMIKHKDELEPNVLANLERYMNERMGVKIGEKR